MRRTKEVNLVNISFIDMLAGALGSVLILFIIVPKVSFADLDKLNAMDSLSVNKIALDSAIAGLAATVPEVDYLDLKNKSAALQSSMNALQSQVSDVQSALVRRTDAYNNLAAKYNQKIAELDAIKKRATAAQKVAAPEKIASKNQPLNGDPKTVAVKTEPSKTQAPAETGKTPDNTPGVGDAIFGIDPPLTIMINWDDKKEKVHLYMHHKASNAWCFYQTKRRRTTFATWDNSLKKLSSKPFEAIVQKEGLVPGEYDLYVLADDSEAGSVPVGGFIAMKLPEKPPKKYTLSGIEARNGKAPYAGGSDGFIGTLSVSADNINWHPK